MADISGEIPPRDADKAASNDSSQDSVDEIMARMHQDAYLLICRAKSEDNSAGSTHAVSTTETAEVVASRFRETSLALKEAMQQKNDTQFGMLQRILNLFPFGHRIVKELVTEQMFPIESSDKIRIKHECNEAGFAYLRTLSLPPALIENQLVVDIPNVAKIFFSNVSSLTSSSSSTSFQFNRCNCVFISTKKQDQCGKVSLVIWDRCQDQLQAIITKLNDALEFRETAIRFSFSDDEGYVTATDWVDVRKEGSVLE